MYKKRFHEVGELPALHQCMKFHLSAPDGIIFTTIIYDINAFDCATFM